MALTTATIPSQTSGSVVSQQNFVNQAPVLGGAIWKYSYNRNKWSRMFKRSTLEDGQGDELRTMNTERAILGSANRATWQRHAAIGASSLATGTTPPDVGVGRGLPPVTVMTHGSRVRSYYRYWAAIQSTRIDANDARMSWKYKEQVANMYSSLFDVTDREWGYKLRESYFSNCDTKVIIGATATTTNPLASLNVVSPTDFSTMVGYSLAQLNSTGIAPSSGYSTAHSTLTGGVLRGIYARQCRIGAADNPPGRTTNGRAALVLMTSMEQIDYLLREPGARDDHRWADASVLLADMGVERTLDNFALVQDDEIPRFTLALNGSTYDFTQVQPWTLQAGMLTVLFSAAASGGTGLTTLTVDTSVGLVTGNVVRLSGSTVYGGEYRVAAVPSTTTVTIEATFSVTSTGTLTLVGDNGQSRAVENPDFQNAPYEGSFIIHQDVMEIQTPPPLSSLGSGAMVDPAKTLGEFQWLNIKNEDTNPRGTIGFFDGVLEFAARPGKTNYGTFILHRRATPEYLASPSFAVQIGLGLNQ